MNAENVRKKMAVPWMSYCTDSPSIATEGVFLKVAHPPPRLRQLPARTGEIRTEEKVLTMEEAIRKMTALPARTLRLDRRGMLKEGYFADLVVFDPENVQDHATYQQPHQYSSGILHVFVNGVAVLKDGEHTGALPGRVVRGPGWKNS